MYISRQLEKQIQPFLKRKEFLAIIGSRQAGKTTFLLYLEKEFKKAGKKIKFFSFEKRSDLVLFEESIEDFMDLYKGYQIIIIDEFQYVKEGGKKLKYLFDTSKTKYIISGSSSLDLTFQTGKYMVGRLFNFTLQPFSFREYLSYCDKALFDLVEKKIFDPFSLKINQTLSREINLRLEKLFEKYLVWGGYPQVVLAKTKIEKQKILESILENYLLKDIKGLLQLATESELIQLVKFLSIQIANLVEYKELSNVCNLPYKNLIKHLEILKQTYIINFLKPFFINKRTELTKNPKVFFIDSGLRNSVISDFREISERQDAGNLAENFVFNVLSKKISGFETLNFWRTKSKAEVDFVIRKNQKIIPIEVKYTQTPIVGKSFYSFIEKFSPKQGFILTKGYLGEKTIKNCKIKFIPVYYF
ncbi:MAG: ATP-binding protein [Candidatus Kuenenbacteria bacterium]